MVTKKLIDQALNNQVKQFIIQVIYHSRNSKIGQTSQTQQFLSGLTEFEASPFVKKKINIFQKKLNPKNVI